MTFGVACHSVTQHAFFYLSYNNTHNLTIERRIEKMKRITKKGQLEALAPAVFVLILAAFLIVLGMQLLGGFQNSTDNFKATVLNESGYLNGTGYTLVRSDAPGYNTQVILNIRNGTSGALINAANYTVVGNKVYNSSANVFPTANISYTYLYGQQSYTSSNQTIYDIGGFADYWELIVLAIVIGVIITLLLLAFGRNKVQ